MTESVQAMAQRLNKAFDTGGERAGDDVLAEIGRRFGRSTVIAVLDEWQRQNDFERAEFEAEYENNKRLREQLTRLLKASGAETVGQATGLMAERGDPFAKEMHAYFDSRQYRLEEALAVAAVKLHPGWRCEGDGRIRKLDDAAPEPPALIEWLYKTHPARAREIEASIA